MSGLLYLDSSDFFVSGDIMQNNIRGFSFIMFYSTQCVYCQDLIPIFKKLPNSVEGCSFGLINVSNNKDVIKMSQNTRTKIAYVPLLILYINGRPYMKYEGPSDEQEIKKFIIEVSSNLKNKQKFAENDTRVERTKNKIPGYSLGIPKDLKNSGVCYVLYEDAYNKK
jgi:thiol-disulfide isomerase/thioredoxin